MFKLLALAMALIYFPAHAQFTNESELGIAAANGNTKTQTYTARQLNDYKWDKNVLSFKSRYLNARANGVESARYIMFGARYEKQVSDHFGLFIGETLEKDKFAGIDQRLLFDFGGKYRFIENEKTKLFSELGYRYLDERRLDGTVVYSHFARLYNEWDNKWNESFSTKYWLEFLPNISEDKDWQLNTELSVTTMMNSIFSLKTGVLVRYDHFPAPGIVYKTDTLFSTALVAKF